MAAIDGALAAELEEREAEQAPLLARLAAVIDSGRDLASAFDKAA